MDIAFDFPEDKILQQTSCSSGSYNISTLSFEIITWALGVGVVGLSVGTVWSYFW